MNSVQKLFSKYIEDDIAFIDKEFVVFAGLEKQVQEYLRNIENELKEYKKTGRITSIGSDKDVTTGSLANNRSSIKENVGPTGKGTNRSTRTRSQRNAFKDASQNINIDSLRIKAEKLSIAPPNIASMQTKVKTETEEMPAPTRLPPRKKRQKEESGSRMTRSKIKQEKMSICRPDSDVIIHEVPITTVEIEDDGEKRNLTDENSSKSVRSTRTRTRKRVMNEAEKRSSSSSSKESDKKRHKQDNANTTKYEDAVSNVDELDKIETATPPSKENTTFVSTTPVNKELNKASALNETVVVEKPTISQAAAALMTDDESSPDDNKKPTTRNVGRPVVKSKKQVFSPFESSPVKKRVEAFEKLAGSEITTAPPTRVTRTKARAMKEENVEVAPKETQGPGKSNPSSVVKERAKLFTPTALSKIAVAKASSSSSKTKPTNSSISEVSYTSKSSSAMKASQAEVRDREKKRREKEEEAIRKREAQILAQMELRKKRNEEKQLKAQQQREALEKEKQKMLEEQRHRDEQKHKQLLAEQEEKKRRLREEAERKRQQAKTKALEEKMREQKRLLEEKKKALAAAAAAAKEKEEAEVEVIKPLYMREAIPYLPLDDRYDSDEEEAQGHKIRFPSWSSESKLVEFQQNIINAGDRLKNTFFVREAETADLQEVFEVIDPKKLKRNSSAIWQKAPRYTLLPTIDQGNEDESDN